MLGSMALIIAFLCGMTDVKVADIQSVEIAVIVTLAIAILSPQARGFSLRGHPIIMNAIPQYILLFVLLFVGSLLSLRITFYPIEGTGPLKQPPWATFIRLIEVILSVSAMFIVALSVDGKPAAFKKVIDAFIWCAYISCVWAIISAAGWLVGLKLPGATAGTIPRMCGFFVEGGPFGLYLTGALLLHLIRFYYLRYVTRRSFLIGAALLSICILGAQSKSAILLVISLAAVFLYVTKRFSVIALVICIGCLGFFATNAYQGLAGYYKSRQQITTIAYERRNDYNLVMGRVMASVLLPRITAEHPLLGVGLGNYSLVRNDPKILRGLPQVNQWDLHSLGVLGYCAELGIPLTLFVIWLYSFPFFLARRSRSWIPLLAAYPPLAAIFGVQLNFAYPWVIEGIALAAIAIDRDTIARLRMTRNVTEGSPARAPVQVGARAPARTQRKG